MSAASVAAEVASLAGKFDHRNIRAYSARETFGHSMAALAVIPERAAVLHIGHSTHLLSMGRTRLLTDPWFYDPAFGALEHAVGPATSPEDVGPIHGILVTHDHPDHADFRAMDRLDKRATAIVPSSDMASRMRTVGFREVVVLLPWESIRVLDTRITAVPALHDVYEIGFLVSGAGKKLYFAGDTRIHPDLAAIAERFAPDVAILPVDGTRYRGGAPQTMTPEDAVDAARILGVSLVVPSHAEAIYSDPVAKHVLTATVLQARAKFARAMERTLPAVRCVLPEPGRCILMNAA